MLAFSHPQTQNSPAVGGAVDIGGRGELFTTARYLSALLKRLFLKNCAIASDETEETGCHTMDVTCVDVCLPITMALSQGLILPLKHWIHRFAPVTFSGCLQLDMRLRAVLLLISFVSDDSTLAEDFSGARQFIRSHFLC